METHETGEPRNDVEAQQVLHGEHGLEWKMVSISTCKMAELVLLRIADMADAA